MIFYCGSLRRRYLWVYRMVSASAGDAPSVSMLFVHATPFFALDLSFADWSCFAWVCGFRRSSPTEHSLRFDILVPFFLFFGANIARAGANLLFVFECL